MFNRVGEDRGETIQASQGTVELHTIVEQEELPSVDLEQGWRPPSSTHRTTLATSEPLGQAGVAGEQLHLLCGAVAVELQGLPQREQAQSVSGGEPSTTTKYKPLATSKPLEQAGVARVPTKGAVQGDCGKFPASDFTRLAGKSAASHFTSLAGKSAAGLGEANKTQMCLVEPDRLARGCEGGCLKCGGAATACGMEEAHQCQDKIWHLCEED